MEKYFIIENEELINDYNEWELNDKLMREAFREFADEIGLEAKEYYAYSHKLMVVLTHADSIKFKSSLLKNSDEEFKKTSAECKKWVNMCKERGIKTIRKPFMGDYLEWGVGKAYSNVLKIDGIFYGYFEKNSDFELPPDYKEIKSWEYHKVIDDYNERITNKGE